MKGDMEVEVLNDTTQSDQLRRGRKRMDRIVGNAAEQELFCSNPVAARFNDRPGYSSDPEYGPEDN
jgi:hypothetical protein